MDLDILLYGEQVLNTPDLVIPHSRMHERGFVLIPLAEIAPHCLDPVSKKYIGEMLAQLKDTHAVKRIAPAHAIYQYGDS
jgi:2-amino-4-hydroxy-6-hydroxymethyldihydropteridine diphosphokinase